MTNPITGMGPQPKPIASVQTRSVQKGNGKSLISLVFHDKPLRDAAPLVRLEGGKGGRVFDDVLPCHDDTVEPAKHTTPCREHDDRDVRLPLTFLDVSQTDAPSTALS